MRTEIPPVTSDLAAARLVLSAQPFSGLLGARLTAFGDGGATLELDVREELLQQNGFVHGGVLGYLADNALTFAAGSVLGPHLLTSGFTIDYLRPVTGRLVRADAQVVTAGRTRAVCRCHISAVDADGTPTVCAVAQGHASVTGPRPSKAQAPTHS